jgi:hypothetical protein
MTTKNWLKTLRNFVFGTPTKPVAKNPNVSTVRLGFEGLEGRVVPAATLNISAGSLSHNGAGVEVNNLTISYDSGTDTYTFVDTAGITLGAGAVTALWTSINATTVEGSGASVTSTISISLGSGNDVVTINSINDNFSVSAGNNDDQIILNDISGKTATSILGGADNDIVTATTGNDTIRITNANKGSIDGLVTIFDGVESLNGGTGDDTFIVQGGTLSGSINGGGDNDTLQAGDVANTWTINNGDGGAVTGVGGGFASIENVVGGSDDDSFTFTGAGNLSGTLSGGIGGLGNNTINYASLVSQTVTLTGDNGTSYDGNIALVTGGFSGINGITGSAAGTTDQLEIDNAYVTSNFWNITGANAGDLNFSLLTFAAFENLVGGTSDDTFVFTGAATVTSVDGGTGGVDDYLDFVGYGADIDAVLSALGGDDGFDGTVTGVASFANINRIDATGGTTDSLTGINANANFTVQSGDDTYTSTNILVFTGFNDLIGNGGTDTFDISEAHTGSLSGLGGNDDFNFLAGGSVTGTVAGGVGSDSLDYSVNVTVSLTNSTTDGYAGDDGTIYTGGFTNIDSVSGAGAADQINGDDLVATWTLNATSTYNDSGLGGNLTFAGFETLQGGTDVDTFDVNGAYVASTQINAGAGADVFNFNVGGSVIAAINGEGGSDTLNYDATVAAILTGSTANGYDGTDSAYTGGFAGIDVITGGAAGDLLTGEGVASTWSLDGTPTYDDNGGNGTLSFSGFETLQGGLDVDTFQVDGLYNQSTQIKGGAGDDVFNFNTSGSVTATIDGQTDSDTINYTVGNTTVTLTGSAVNGYAGNDAGTFSGGFVGINSLTATTGGDSLTGENVLSTWTLGAAPTYDDGGAAGTLAFSGFETLQGGTGVDIFDVTGNYAQSTSVLGGAGADAFTFADGTLLTATTVDGEADNDTFDFDGGDITGTVTGGADDDNFNFNANVTSATSVLGGTGLDLFTFDEGSAATTNIDGEAGNDAFDFDGGDITGTVTGGADDDNFNFNANVTGISGNITGGTGLDDFNFTGGTTTATISGGANTDSVNYTVGSAAVILTGSAADGYTGTDGGFSGGFSGINVATAATGGDSLTGENVASTWTLDTTATYDDGGAAATLVFSGFETLQGGTNVDTFDVDGAYGDSTQINAGTGADVFNLNVGGSVSAAIDGEGGSDTLNYGATVVAILTGSSATNGYAGTDSAYTSGFAGINVINATGAGDSLQGRNVLSNWSLDATPTYNDGTGGDLSFSGFDTLQGGSGVDIFTMNGLFSATSLLGGAGNDVFNFNAANDLTASVDGQGDNDDFNFSGGDVDGIVNGGAGADDFNFNADTDVTGDILGGLNDDTFTFTASATSVTVGLFIDGEGGDDNFLFQGGDVIFGLVTGGIGSDDFVISASTTANGDIFGGADGDNFTFSGTGTVFAGNANGEDGNDDFFMEDDATVTGTLDAGNDFDTLDYTNYTAGPVTVDLTNNMATGVDGNIFNFENFVAVDVIIAPLTNNTWNITGIDDGNINGTFFFTDTPSLVGGNLVDNFVFGNGFYVTGSVNGGGGVDAINFSAYDGTTALGFLIGNTGSNNAGTINVDLAPLGPIDETFTFTSVESHTGGDGNDSFTLSAGRGLTGLVNGDAGNDTLSYAAYTTNVTVNLLTGTGTAIGGAVSGIETVIGGTRDDRLFGDNNNNVLIGNAGNNVLVGNGGADSLTGGAGRDLLIGGSGADSLNGGTNDDILVGSATTYDANLTALNRVMSEWTSARTYMQRVNNITAGLGNTAGTMLTATQCVVDGVDDTLLGAAGTDWFFSSTAEEAFDDMAGAEVKVSLAS